MAVPSTKMVRDTSAFTLSSCPKASLNWVRGGARDEYSVHPSGNISARITLGPAPLSTTAFVGVGVCHGATWYDAPISKFSLRNSSKVPLNRGRYRPRRQGHRAGTGHFAVTPGDANVTRRGATGELGRTRGVKRNGEATPPRRFPPRGAPWTGLPRAGRHPHPSWFSPRGQTGRPTAGPRR